VSESVTGAIAKRDEGPGAIIRQYSDDFQQVLPSHINGPTWVRLAQGVLRRDKNLAAAAKRNPASLMQALLECARLGHEPGTESFYLIPMGGEIEGWEGYRGVVERMYRAGAVTAVKAEVVKANDQFEFSPTEMDVPIHKIDWFSNRGEAIGAWAYADMIGGVKSRVVVINQEYLQKVRAESKGSNSASSPWKKWEDSMILKTALHRLEPFVPTSSEYIREKLRAERDVAAESAPQRGTSPVRGNTEIAPVDVSHLSEIRDDDPDLAIDAEVVDDS
jgi:recombination protein RecT